MATVNPYLNFDGNCGEGNIKGDLFLRNQAMLMGGLEPPTSKL